ncbi:MAG: nucleotidyltransferase family protein [Anaerolineae bacterium]|nr:nucleotidyltransferase family protein [Anaerolineae bacterium]
MFDLFPQDYTETIRFLIACLSPEPVSLDVDAWRARVDGYRLAAYAVDHGTAGLLRRRLAGLDLLPPLALARLDSVQRQNDTFTRLVVAELVRLLESAHRRHLPLIPIKGPLLSSLLYDDPALRISGDLDLLTTPETMPAALEWLGTQDYEAVESDAAARHSVVFQHHHSRLIIELHEMLLPPVYDGLMDDAGVWRRLQTLPAFEREIQTLSPPDLLLYLCLHGSKHCWFRLSWIVDIAFYVQRVPPLDWENLLAEASRRGSRRMLLLGLRLAQVCWQIPLPTTVTRQMQADAPLEMLTTQVMSRLFAPDSLAAFTDPKFYHPFQMALLERESHRERYRKAYPNTATGAPPV